jgi:hypothetical protein
MLLTGLCILLAIGIVATLVYLSATTLAPATVDQTARYDASLVFFEHSQPFDVTDLEQYELLGGLAHVRDTVPSSLGSFTSIDMYATSFDPVQSERIPRALSLSEFFSQARFSSGDALGRSLTGDYMVLIHQGERATPVLLLKTSSPDSAFASMLSWEKALPQNLSPFFPLGTLALAETPPQFQDLSFNNIDTRALYDGAGSLILLYALLERDVLAITNSISTMQEVASRLHVQRLKR